MQPETATKAVDLVFRSASPCVKIEFQGGEPLLNFQVVRHIVEYAEQLNRKAKKDLEFVICTNLTAVEDHQLEFCKEHGVVISMSLDGPREIHNACRRMADGEGSYDPVMAGLEKARKYMGDRIAAMMTTTRSSLMRFREVVDEYLRDGFRSIFLRSLNPYGRAVSNRSELQYPMEEFIASYKDGLDYIIELNLRGIPFVEEYASLILMRMLTPFATGFVDLQSPTGAGIGGVIYDYDGSVYVSDEGRMLARSGDRTFRMGSVLENTYEELFGGEVIRRTVDASCVECLPQCRDCAFQMWCGADPVRNYAT
jgi:His-Xaa-Ser system radical SAM maturase HxsB